MWIVTILVLLGLMAVYFVVGSFGMVMSAFCFDAGVSPAAWQCFAGINALFSAPLVIALVVAWVQFLCKRYRWAMIIAAVPAVLVGVAYVALYIYTASYLG